MVNILCMRGDDAGFATGGGEQIVTASLSRAPERNLIVWRDEILSKTRITRSALESGRFVRPTMLDDLASDVQHFANAALNQFCGSSGATTPDSPNSCSRSSSPEDTYRMVANDYWCDIVAQLESEVEMCRSAFYTLSQKSPSQVRLIQTRAAAAVVLEV